MQCLMRKVDVRRWKPEEEDQDFELESELFLTSFGHGCSNEEDLDFGDHSRHDVYDVDIVGSSFNLRSE